MPYIPPEVVVQAREMDLLTYLRTYEPQELVHFGGGTYCTREHDSLKISNGKWCWFSRGIGSDFIGDANGSDKHYSFGIPAATASDTLHLFESAVDLLSYGTLQKLDGKGWRSENLLSLAGVYKPRAKIEESSLPAALVRYLSEHPRIRRVVLRLDNDTAGRIAAETIKTLLPRKYAVTVDIQPPPQGKDYNDCLCMRLGLPITKRGERSKER